MTPDEARNRLATRLLAHSLTEPTAREAIDALLSDVSLLMTALGCEVEVGGAAYVKYERWVTPWQEVQQ